MDAAEACELSLLQTRDHAEDAFLLGVLELGLKADDVEKRAERIVLAKLDHRVGTLAGAGVDEADRLHRTEAQRVAAARGHHLDGKTTLEIRRRGFPFLELRLLAGQKGVDERLVLVAVERTVDVISAVAARSRLVPAGLKPGTIEVDRVPVHDRSDGIEERQRVLAGQPADRIGESGGGERTGGDDDAVPVLRRQSGNFLADRGDQRFRLDRGRDGGGKALAVDRKRCTRGNLVRIGRAHDQGSAAA